jgi:hypothetical protein
MRANDEGLLAGIPALKVGEYEIRSGSQEIDRVGVALLNGSESSLAAVDKISFNEVAVAARTDQLQEDRPLWTQLAFLAFWLLLIEWWYFQKKPAGVPD